MKRTILLGLATSLALGAGTKSAAAVIDKKTAMLKQAVLVAAERNDALKMAPRPWSLQGQAWKTGIMATVFWVGETPTRNNPVPNDKSSWDSKWARNYGGFDNPDPQERRGYLPADFVPRQNPFYIALPYNDVSGGRTKSEARAVIPWFKDSFVREGQSVCKGRWVAIRYKGREAYAQWEDCGPFRTDHWEYVFGNERPRPNLNQGAGIDISPAVRDYLGMKTNDAVDWRFVEFNDVPHGPWALYGDNNHFVMQRRNGKIDMASSAISHSRTAQADRAGADTSRAN